MSIITMLLYLSLLFPIGTIYVVALLLVPVRAFRIIRVLKVLNGRDPKDEAQIKKAVFARNIAVGATVVLWVPFIVLTLLNR
ncbi:MAG: hypothetical protein IIZ73_05620 [Ruminococcus sp.]|nr:hypothetical protein [Ruminococcus sp.]